MTHQRNLWPMGITLAFVGFAAGIAVLVALACSNRMDLVTADYYEQEIRYQSHMESLQRASVPGSNATIAYAVATQRITISLPPHHASAAASGRIHLYRPSASRLDREIPLQVGADGVQTLDASGLRTGLWKVRVAWTVGGEEFFLDQTVIIGG